MIDSVRSAYDQLAEDYASHFPATGPEAPIDLAMLDQCLSLLPESPDVLDAGCGTGRIAKYLTDRGASVHGIDLSHGMLRMAQRDHPGIPVTRGSITELPYCDDSFDAVVYWYSTIHLPDADVQRAFGEAARVLRPDALAVVAFHVGDEVRDIGPGFRSLGHDVRLDRYHRSLDAVLAMSAAEGFVPLVTVARDPLGDEKDPQASVLLRRGR